jgi:hypothetical protein
MEQLSNNENATEGELLMEAQMSPKIRGEKSLVVRTIEPSPKEVELGVVELGRAYKKGESVNLKTDKGWWLICHNEEKTWLLGDAPEFAKCLDD